MESICLFACGFLVWFSKGKLLLFLCSFCCSQGNLNCSWCIKWFCQWRQGGGRNGFKVVVNKMKNIKIKLPVLIQLFISKMFNNCLFN